MFAVDVDGYTMLPMHSHDAYKDKRNLTLKEKLAGWWRLIFSDRNSRNLLLFLLLNLSFAFVELVYGVWTNSLGLISDSFHMFFDCTGLLAGLAASIITKWKANEKYSYGYVRAEVIAGFVNSLFLLFIAFFILSEGVERLIEPPEVKHERLFVVSVLGLLVNLVGIYAFQHGHGHSHGGGGHGHSHGGGSNSNHSHGGGQNNHSHGGHNDEHHLLMNHSDHGNHVDHGHSHNDIKLSGGNSQIMRGVFLHILADTLGSVGVIISAVLMQMFGWMIADPICSIFIALLIALSVLSLIRESIMILMQRTPIDLDHALPQCLARVKGLAGVESVHEPHFWTLCSGVFVGGLILQVNKEAVPKYLITHVQNIFKDVGVKQIYIQLDYV